MCTGLIRGGRHGGSWCAITPDEPSNHLDLEQLEGLEAALRSYDGAIFVSSHDEALLDAIGVSRREEVLRWR